MKHRREQLKPRLTGPRTAGASQPLKQADRKLPGAIASESSSSRGPGRRILFRATAVLLVPLVLLGGIELGLRIAGYGYSTSFFKPIRIGDQKFLVENDKFGWRFFPPEIARSPSPLRILAHKPPGTYRIFLFGESAALGDPQPAFGVGRYLQALLRERYPQAKFEVVCAAMTAINSHALLPIARECARLEGDLWIIYMGNNEMIGPFGASTVFGSPTPPLWYVRVSLAMERTRLGQLLLSVGRHIRSGNHGPSWGGMRMWVEHRIAPNDRHKEAVYRSFEQNLGDILQTGRAAKVPMILSTVAVNLKDCPPFASLQRTNLSDIDRAALEGFYAEATQAQQQGNLVQADQQFERAAALDSSWADLQFRWGQCLMDLTNSPAARSHFQQARDADALPFRSDSRINEVIVQTGRRLAGPDLTLFDAVGLFETNSPVGIPGDEVFYEHVHLNFDGNYRLARALASVIGPLVPSRLAQRPQPSWASQETCEEDLGLTDWNRRDVYQDMVRRLRQPPFTRQQGHAQKVQTWQSRLEELQRQLTLSNAEAARKVYLEALLRWPDDFRLHWKYADFLEARRLRAESVTEWKTVRALIPEYHVPYYEIGRLLAAQGQDSQARTWLLQSLALRPDLSEGWYELGRVQGAGGEFEAALQSFSRARQLLPEEPRYHLEMGKALVKLNRSEQAIAQLQEAIRLGGGSWEAHYLLGEQLAFANRITDARAEFEKTLQLKPGYAMAHFNLGVTFVKQGHLEEARQQFEQVLRLDPNNAQAQSNLRKLQAAPH